METNVKIISKKTGKEQHEKIYTRPELKEFIAGISSTDLKTKKYQFDLNVFSMKAFEELYTSRFYSVIPAEKIIVLKPLPNGVHRTKGYKKSINYEKTFQNALKRIEKTLSQKLPEEGYDVVKVESQPLGGGTKEAVFIDIKDRSMDNAMATDKGIKYNPGCKMVFNKKEWTYELLDLTAFSNFQDVYRIIKTTFEKHTSSTRNYRKKRANKIK